MKKLYLLSLCLLGVSAAGISQCTVSATVTPTGGLNVSATATGTGALAAAYGWDWGDTQSTYLQQTATHTYAAAGTYNVCAYYLDLQDTSCNATDCHSVTVSTVGVQEAGSGVNSISAYPNPFGATTTFNVSLAKNADVEISVYDVTGQKVETVKDEEMSAGNHAIVWTPATLADGVYFVQMVIDGQTTTKRIVHTSVR